MPSSAQSTTHAAAQAEGLGGWLRLIFRGLGIVVLFAGAAIDYGWVRRTKLPEAALLAAQARWLHRWSRRVARLISLEVGHRGEVPVTGMIVSNHLSYLDIFVYSAITPCVFVAKAEVARWPFFGPYARMAGTIFVDRTRRMAVSDINAAIARALEARVAVVLFPEGTCWDGLTLLPFKPSLLEPAARTRCPLSAAGLAYFLPHGSVRDEICYWGTMTLGPHLLNVLRKPLIRAAVRFGSEARGELDRKALAVGLHAEVLGLRDAISFKN